MALAKKGKHRFLKMTGHEVTRTKRLSEDREGRADRVNGDAGLGEKPACRGPEEFLTLGQHSMVCHSFHAHILPSMGPGPDLQNCFINGRMNDGPGRSPEGGCVQPTEDISEKSDL